ncbi:hypothetical protein [Longispora urticae]
MELMPTAAGIAALDIEGYGRRTETEQARLRTAMYRATEAAVTGAGMDWDACVALDRGDSIILLCPPSVSPVLLVQGFQQQLLLALREHAADPDAPAMRMRLALHVGFVSADPQGWVGNAINAACRLVDLPSLRRVLAQATASPLAAILSDSLHEATVAQHHGGLDAGAYHPVPVVTKELRTTGWVTVPGYRVPPGLTDPPAPPDAPAAGVAPTGPAAHYASEGAMFNGPVTINDTGVLIGRDQYQGGVR